MGLVDAARILAAVIAELAGAGTPLEAAKAWRQAHIEREASMPLGEAIKLFLATRDGLRLHTIRGYGWYLGPNWLNTSKIARRRAGWDLSLPHIPKGLALPPITRGAWPKNVCRHTCASTQIAIGTPLDDLNFKFGHSGGSKLLKSHYIGRMTKKQALEILSIGPKNSKIAQLQAVG